MAAPPYAVVVVTLNPDPRVFARLLASLAARCVVVVDNGSAPTGLANLRDLVRVHPGAHLRENGRNLGLAAALNIGAAEARAHLPECRYLVFLDHDTEPGDGNVERLVETAAQLCDADPTVGLVGPRMVDATTGASHGFYVVRRGLWGRSYPAASSATTVPCAVVNGSGSVVPLAAFDAAGGFDESLFVDHVDTDWSFRIAHAGYQLRGVPQIAFRHRMGERSLRFWLGGWRVWPYRAPARHFYVFRNAVALMRRSHVPVAWKVAAPFKLLLTAVVHALADPARAAQLRAMLSGVVAGLRVPPVARPITRRG